MRSYLPQDFTNTNSAEEASAQNSMLKKNAVILDRTGVFFRDIQILQGVKEVSSSGNLTRKLFFNFPSDSLLCLSLKYLMLSAAAELGGKFI